MSPKIKEEFTQWNKKLEEAIKKGITEENSHLLQCPSRVLLEMHGKNIEIPHPYQVWQDSSVITYKGTKYLKILRIKGKNENSTTLDHPIGIIKSYRDSSQRRSKKTLEENSLTMLNEPPSQHRCISKKGNIVTKLIGRPVISPDDEPPSQENMKGNQQQYLTPLGKKGLVAFHTGHQYCSLNIPIIGEFQRFFIGNNPYSALQRAIHTLGKLANADSNNLQQATTKITGMFNLSLKALAKNIQNSIETCIDDYLDPQDHVHLVAAFGVMLPQISLANSGHKINLSLCEDKAYGYTFQSSAISLKTNHPNPTAHDNEVCFKSIWASLQKK